MKTKVNNTVRIEMTEDEFNALLNCFGVTTPIQFLSGVYQIAKDGISEGNDDHAKAALKENEERLLINKLLRRIKEERETYE